MPSVVETKTGKLEGVDDDGLRVFKGVPFARPPVGELRFAPPAPVEAWSGVRPASEFGPVSLQSSIGLGFMGPGQQPQSEDCLYLNVWTPGLDSAAARPVMVWIHGGAFILGAGSEPLYEGRDLARRGDVVVVTVNYRLGALGYLAHPAVRDESTGACGNWGLLDQVAALEWVRDNIAAFGGDPGNVTVFGESAGSASVTTLMGTPRARGLFRRVIGQSGTPWVATAEGAQASAQKLLDLLEADAPSLRDIPAERFVEGQQQLMMSARASGGSGGLEGDMMAFRPTVDGAVLPRSPWDAIADGEASEVALLTGTNRDEMKLFSMLDQGAELDDVVLAARVSATAGVDGSGAEQIVDSYRKARESRGEKVDPKELWAAIETDRFFRAPAAQLAALQSAHQPDTFTYLFCWESPIEALGSSHAVELPFVFGTFDAPMVGMFAGTGPEAEALHRIVQDAWIAFARTGNPAHPGLPDWPRHDASRRATMIFDRATSAPDDNPRGDELSIWLDA